MHISSLSEGLWLHILFGWFLEVATYHSHDESSCMFES